MNSKFKRRGRSVARTEKYDADTNRSSRVFVFDSPVLRDFACCNLKKVRFFFPSQLAKLHGEGASVRTLQGAVEALERDKAALEERTLRLEKELAAAKNTLNLPSGKPWRARWPCLCSYRPS